MLLPEKESSGIAGLFELGMESKGVWRAVFLDCPEESACAAEGGRSNPKARDILRMLQALRDTDIVPTPNFHSPLTAKARCLQWVRTTDTQEDTQ